MADEHREHNDNPLDEAAAQASGRLQADRVEADHVAVAGSAVQRVEAGQVQMSGSSAGHVQAHALHVEGSAVGSVRGGAVELADGLVGIATGEAVKLKDVAASFIVARHAEAEQVRTVVLVAGRVDGSVSTVFTVWTALAAGAGMGVALFGLRMLGGRLRRRSQTKRRA